MGYRDFQVSVCVIVPLSKRPTGGTEPLQEQLAALRASVQQRAVALTGIPVDEQKAWADLAQSVQTTADQVGFLARLLGSLRPSHLVRG